ncbi:MAG: hypothetical protein KDD40_03520 [Bdellovibrionales bacterium]|nr:hypothetical protein [Bdellovibrionales bacterium]
MKTGFFTLFLCLFLINCGQGSGKVPIQKSKNTSIINSKPNFSGPIVLLGDGLSLGKGSSSKESSLEGCLQRLTNETIVNIAEEAEDSRSIFKKLNQLILLKPSAIIISLGLNDALLNLNKNSLFSDEETIQNLREIYRRIRPTGALMVHLGIQPPYPGMERMRKIQDLAQREGVLYIRQIMKGLWNQSAFMYDLFYPNNEGYKILCTRLRADMKKHYNF